MATGLEQFIGMYKPQTLQEVLMPMRQQGMEQEKLNMEERLLPLREQLLKAQAAKAMQPAQAPVFQQKLQTLGAMLRGANIPEEDIVKAQQMMMLRDVMGGGGLQTSVTTPSGETVQIGQGGGGMSGLPQSIQQALGMSQPTMGIEAGTQKSKSGYGGAVTVDPEGLKSQPTMASTSQMQKQLQSVDSAEKALTELGKTLPKYQNLLNRGMAEAGGFLSRAFGGEGQGASELAESESNLVNAVESYLTAFNLPKTNESFAAVHRALAPRKNESEKGYANRLKKEVEKIKQRKQIIAKNLRGIPLDGKQQPEQKSKVVDYRDYF